MQLTVCLQLCKISYDVYRLSYPELSFLSSPMFHRIMAWQRICPGSLAKASASYLPRPSRTMRISLKPTPARRIHGTTNFLATKQGKYKAPSHKPQLNPLEQAYKQRSYSTHVNGTRFGAPENVNAQMVRIEPYEPYPSFWLRENCQCSSCIHPLTRQRMVSTLTLPKDIQANSVDVGTEQVTIKWSDGHTGAYPRAWLSDHQLHPAIPPSQEVLQFRDFRFVSDGLSHPTVEYQDVMTTTEGLALWLTHIVDYGYCMVRGVPLEPEVTQRLLERIAFIRHTHYGGFWDFTSDLTYKDTAYTSEALDVHTDNTYFSDPARLQLFHLLSHTGGEGGQTVLVDGFLAAATMCSENRANVKALTDIPQPWHSSGNDDVCIQPYQLFPVFERDESTAILRRIRWNNYDRAVKVDWTPQEAELWYEAARHYNRILSRESMQMKMQLEPGTALIFDNWRMLHGRTAFSGKRRMCGGYINNDDFISRYRLLKDGREKTLNKIGTLDARITC